MRFALKKGIVLFSLAATLVGGGLCLYQSHQNSLNDQNSKNAQTINARYQKIRDNQTILISHENGAQIDTLGVWRAPTGHLYAVSVSHTSATDNVAVCPIKMLSAQMLDASHGSNMEYYQISEDRLVKETLNSKGKYEHDLIAFGLHNGAEISVSVKRETQAGDGPAAKRIGSACEDAVHGLQAFIYSGGEKLALFKAGLQ